MNDLMDLYQELILDHNQRPRNFRPMGDAHHKASGFNSLCGDKVEIFVRLNGDQVEEISFQGAGCAISQASASLLTEMVKNRSTEEAMKLFDAFRTMVTVEQPSSQQIDLGKLNALASVRKYPMRVKCATLAWHTFKAALEGLPEPISTE
ncbi:MAG: Fe-S cluster assembly sulfur transfer protein SufU [Acidobacteriota bacterium]